MFFFSIKTCDEEKRLLANFPSFSITNQVYLFSAQAPLKYVNYTNPQSITTKKLFMTGSAAGCRSTKTDEQQISAEVIGKCLRAAVLSPADQRARVEQSRSLDVLVGIAT